MGSAPSAKHLEYAREEDVLGDAWDAFLPADVKPVDAWAAERRWLANEGGGHIGLWDPATAPYLNEPMRALTDDRYGTVVIVGPGQCGKTEVANNWMLQSIDTDPAGMLRYMQTDDAIRAYVKDRINPMIELHDGIRLKQYPRPIDDSLGFKRFRGMAVQFLSAARSNLISKSAPRIILDEIDAYDPSLGDVKNLADIRRQAYSGSKLLLISHPDRADGLSPSAWKAGIMATYRESTRATWWCACPECGAHSSLNPGTSRYFAIAYPDDAPIDTIAGLTYLACPVNGCVISNERRLPMVAAGRWVHQGETISQDGIVTGERIRSATVGYWIVGAMSPFIDEIGGIGALARARVQAERALDEIAQRDVATKQWGVPFQPKQRIGTVDAAALADRAETSLAAGTVPPGVRFITAAIDVQANRFEWLARGWGVDGESWLLAWGTRPADPSIDPAAWDAILAQLLAGWPLSDGSGRVMVPRAIGFDSGGAEGVTLQAYGAWRRARTANLARRLGILSGRDVWTILPLKGGAGPNAQSLAVTYPDSARKDRKTGARGEIPVGLFNPNRFKDDLAVHLARAEPGPWYIHLPHSIVGEPAPGPLLAQLTAERRTPRGTWERATAHAPNEMLDLAVMTHVMAHLHGLARLRWATPLSWYAEQAANSYVGRPATPATPAPIVARAAQSSAVTPSASAADAALLARLARLA